jgi:serine/threonine protein kinase
MTDLRPTLESAPQGTTPPDAERDALVVQVLEDYLAALEVGTAPPREQLLAQYPDLAEQLEACLASLDFIRRAAPTGQSLEGRAATHPAPRRTPEAAFADGTLGAYRIVREIGRGGMGIVYEAEHLRLGTRVALKVLPFAAALDPRQLQRFKNEAQAAALLHHPHIVPVLEVGCEQGVHFYVMQLIEGRNLAELIADLRRNKADTETRRHGDKADTETRRQGDKETKRPADKESGTAGPSAATQPVNPPPGSVSLSPCLPVSLSPGLPVSLSPGLPVSSPAFFRTVADLGVQAAEALEQAHQVGIIHRDVKPANLMVNDKGHLWVTDFGLARFDNEASLTLTGDVLGTLRYMSPEQALARRGLVDQRSDIYSLGITLYELLTLQPAFVGRDREELLQRIAQEEPTPPRRLNRALPEDLETIIQKAGAKDPAERYLTAAELADDLRRFLDGKSIRAQRPTVWERVRKWSGRHRSVVVGGAVVLAVAVAALAVSTFFIARERDDARRREQQARRAADEMYTQVAQRWWSQQPYMEQVQREFLLKALRFYEEFAAEKGTDPEVGLEAARAARRVGDIQHMLGDRARAAAAYEQARVRLEQLSAEHPGLAGCREELANVHNNRGNLLRDTGRLDEAVEAYRQAQKLFAELADPAPDDREGLAGSRNNLGMVLHALGRLPEAEETYRHALDGFTALTREFPQVPRYQHALAGSRANLANLLRDTGRPQEAQGLYEQALAAWQKLRSDAPGMPVFMQAQAAAHSGFGILLAARGNTRAAEHAQRQALLLRERLAQDYPSVPAYRQALAASHQNLGRLLAASAGSGRTTQALAFYDQALALRRSLREEAPTVSGYRQELADTLHGRGSLLTALGQLDHAEKDLQEALALRTALAAESPQLPEPRWDLARSHHALGGLFRSRGQVAEAEAAFRAALTLDEGLVAERRHVPAYRLELAVTRNDLGALLAAGNRIAEAEAAHREALTLRKQLAEELPKAPYYQYELAVSHRWLAGVLEQNGRLDEAAAAYREGLAVAQKLTAEFPTIPEYRALMADVLGRLVALLFKQHCSGLARACSITP